MGFGSKAKDQQRFGLEFQPQAFAAKSSAYVCGGNMGVH
jgi:hypothetical protein